MGREGCLALTMRQETNQPSSANTLDELVEQMRGKLWEIRALSDMERSAKKEPSDEEMRKRVAYYTSKKQLLDLVPAIQVCIREHEDPKRAWWLFFEIAFDGLRVTTRFDNGEYALEPPKEHWREKGALAREAYKEELLYLFTRYVVSPPSMEFFEAMFKGWMRNLPRSGYYA